MLWHAYMANPKNCMSRNLGPEVLLLRNARTSCIPWLMRDTSASEITVDPELYSTTVLDFSGCTSLVNMFKANMAVSIA